MVLLDEYVDFLTEHDLTQDQLLFLMLLHFNRIDLIRKYKKSFPNEEGTMISKYLINKLEEKEFIRREEGNLFIGDKFLNLFVNERQATDEVYDAYPVFILSDKGVNIPLKTMDKEIFKKIYIGKIQGSVKEHNEVLKDIAYGVGHDLLKMGINKFLVAEHWKSLRELRKKSKSKGKKDTLYEDF